MLGGSWDPASASVVPAHRVARRSPRHDSTLYPRCQPGRDGRAWAVARSRGFGDDSARRAATTRGVRGGLSSIGRASDCGSEGYGFKPRRPPHLHARAKLTRTVRLHGNGGQSRPPTSECARQGCDQPTAEDHPQQPKSDPSTDRAGPRPAGRSDGSWAGRQPFALACIGQADDLGRGVPSLVPGHAPMVSRGTSQVKSVVVIGSRSGFRSSDDSDSTGAELSPLADAGHPPEVRSPGRAVHEPRPDEVDRVWRGPPDRCAGPLRRLFV